MPVRVVVPRPRRFDDHPEEAEEDLDAYQGGRDDDLRFRADVARAFGGPGGGVEDSRDPVRFRQQRAVDDGKTGADPEALGATGDDRWRGEENVRV